MPQFDIVFEKLHLLLLEEKASARLDPEPSSDELEDIDELRRFSAALQDPDPLSFTTT